MICSSSAIAQQLGDRDVDEAAERQARAERDDLAEQAAARAPRRAGPRRRS